MNYRIVLAPEARDDLCELYLYIEEQAGPERAMEYVDRIMAFCDGFTTFPQRGTARDDLLPGLRIVGFERRVAIAFHIDENTVVFDRFLYAGRNIRSLDRQESARLLAQLGGTEPAVEAPPRRRAVQRDGGKRSTRGRLKT